MNKASILLIGAILCGSLTLTSCQKKKNEPIPNKGNSTEVNNSGGDSGDSSGNNSDSKTGDYAPIKGKENTDEPAPNVEANTIVFRVVSRQFRVSSLEGSNIRVEGVKPLQIAIGSKVRQNYTVEGDGIVTFKGNIKALSINAGAIKDVYLHKAPQSLKEFSLLRTHTKRIDLSQKTSIDSLTLLNLRGLKQIDLSKQTQLRKLVLGKRAKDVTGDWEKVILPEPSILEHVDVSQTSVNSININGNHPNLKEFLASASQVPEITLPHSPNIERVWARRSSGLRRVSLQNKSNLREVVLNESFAEEVVITNAPKLKDMTKDVIGLAIYLEKGNVNHGVKKLDLSYTGITRVAAPYLTKLGGVVELSLRGNTIADFDVQMFENLNKLDIQGAKISTSVLDGIIEGLRNNSNGEIIVNTSLLSSIQEQKLLAKGWRVIKK